jgi:hypothetical protein
MFSVLVLMTAGKEAMDSTAVLVIVIMDSLRLFVLM